MKSFKIPVVAIPIVPEPVMRKAPCAHCPSAHHPIDPECADILSLPHAERVKTAFACGWNQTRYCKGYCDMMGISNSDLETLHQSDTDL